MKNLRLILGAVLISAYLSACISDTHRTYRVETANRPLSNGENLIPNGRVLAMNQCGECHRFYFPKEYDPPSWENILKEKSIRLSLKPEQTAALMAYFITESRKR